MPHTIEKFLVYPDMEASTGLGIEYVPRTDGGAAVKVLSANDKKLVAAASFEEGRLDEAHILYMEATEMLRSRAKLNETPAAIRARLEKLFALFRGEKISFEGDFGGGAKDGIKDGAESATSGRQPSGEFVANPGKKIEIDVDGVTYERLPVRTRVITVEDRDILPLIDAYVKPYVKTGDMIFVSEKALTVTQGRIVDMKSIKPSRFARFLGVRVGNNYGSADFHGFGHGTALAMQLFIEEAGAPRVLFAAAVAAITRPFGIRGMFYRICGKSAKSIDCPMSFLILEYAHSAKLAPNNPQGAARRIKASLGCETVILDANYRGAFSLGKTTGRISEKFVGQLFRDNPLGQSDEMTPFCIVRRKEQV